MPGSGGCSLEVSEGEERHFHGFGHGQHPTVVTGKLDGLPLLPEKMKGCQVQGIERANWKRKSVQCTFEYGGRQFQQSDAAYDPASRITMGFRKHARVQSGPDLVLEQAAGDKSCVPKSIRWATIFGEEVSKGHGSVYVDHRSLRSTSSSTRTSSKGTRGSGTGGVPARGRSGGVNQPFRTASASTASASTGLLVSLGGPISATTRSRSVTRMVSPLAAMRTYSLSRLLRILIPTDLIASNVATSCYCVKDAASGTVCDSAPVSMDSAGAMLHGLMLIAPSVVSHEFAQEFDRDPASVVLRAASPRYSSAASLQLAVKCRGTRIRRLVTKTCADGSGTYRPISVDAARR